MGHVRKGVSGLTSEQETNLDKAHTQNTDTALGALGTKATPIDADKVVQRDSADSDALVTSTWTQIKAFLKTYFDTLYEAAFSKNTAFNKNFGTTVGTTCQGNDSRLSDSRTCNNSFDSAATSRTALGLSDAATTTVATIRSGTTASNVGLGNVPNEDATNPQNWDPAKTDGNFLVGNGTTFVVESGATARASMGAAALGANTFAGTQSFADNVLSRPKLLDVSETVNALGDLGGGTDAINLESGNVVTATVSTSTQTFTFSNPPASGANGSFTLILTNGGSQTVNWPASVDWVAATAPTLTAAGVDVLVFTTNDAGTTWLGFVAGLDVS